jgi:cytochrome oxidase Cu insertion factor (SCO1/SenC/PrrC family)
MREKHPRLTFVSGDESALAPLMSLLGSDAHDHVYLLDPLGNIVLRYGPEASSKGMLKDVKKLLRNSRIG